MVKYLFFLDITNICTSLYIYSGVRKLEFDKLIDKLFFLNKYLLKLNYFLFYKSLFVSGFSI